jgi:hypothetical protein
MGMSIRFVRRTLIQPIYSSAVNIALNVSTIAPPLAMQFTVR